MTSQLSQEPQPKSTAKINPRPGHLSKVAGAGVGTGWIVIAQKFGLSEAWTLALQAAGPSIAVFMGGVLPHATSRILDWYDMRGLRKVLADAEAQVKNTPEGTPSRKQAEANLEQIRQMINEKIQDTAKKYDRRY